MCEKSAMSVAGISLMVNCISCLSYSNCIFINFVYFVYFIEDLADNVLGSNTSNEESGYFSISSGKHLGCEGSKDLAYHYVSQNSTCQSVE
jgi:hypothetical protein